MNHAEATVNNMTTDELLSELDNSCNEDRPKHTLRVAKQLGQIVRRVNEELAGGEDYDSALEDTRDQLADAEDELVNLRAQLASVCEERHEASTVLGEARRRLNMLGDYYFTTGTLLDTADVATSALTGASRGLKLVAVDPSALARSKALLKQLRGTLEPQEGVQQ